MSDSTSDAIKKMLENAKPPDLLQGLVVSSSYKDALEHATPKNEHAGMLGQLHGVPIYISDRIPPGSIIPVRKSPVSFALEEIEAVRQMDESMRLFFHSSIRCNWAMVDFAESVKRIDEWVIHIPEGRWQYQKHILSTPIRLARWLVAWMKIKLDKGNES